jgi:hypothetical protein
MHIEHKMVPVASKDSDSDSSLKIEEKVFSIRYQRPQAA